MRCADFIRVTQRLQSRNRLICFWQVWEDLFKRRVNAGGAVDELLEIANLFPLVAECSRVKRRNVGGTGLIFLSVHLGVGQFRIEIAIFQYISIQSAVQPELGNIIPRREVAAAEG